jgi:adenosyl cobinamide kinase/adenosyl cobinamide phosphate guanylyltransferase
VILTEGELRSMWCKHRGTERTRVLKNSYMRHNMFSLLNMPEENIASLLRSQLGVIHSEDLLVEALRDLVKDEIKRYVRQKLDENPELKQEIKQAVGEFISAKMNETYALLKLTKCGAELGLSMIPKDLREKLGKDIASLLEKEVSQVIEKM